VGTIDNEQVVEAPGAELRYWVGNPNDGIVIVNTSLRLQELFLAYSQSSP
jgi:hypothetical protein